VKNLGYIPVNPEAALGYYVSTTTHGGSKIQVMNDCIKIELLCDEMWIFNPVGGHIPEGVLAEMMVWLKHHKGEIKVIPFFDQYQISSKISTGSNATLMACTDIAAYIQSRKTKDVQEIQKKLFENVDSIKNAYVVANFFNNKHIDWARAYCYKNSLCPVSPQNILPFSLYIDVTGKLDEEYMLDRLTLLDHCEKMVWFSNLDNIDHELSNLDKFSCTEIHYWITYKNSADISKVNWALAGVPKYIKNNQWALTTTELSEVMPFTLNDTTYIRNIQRSIFEYEKKIENAFNIFKGNLLGNNERTLLLSDMNAFLFGLISDQSVKAEIAWSLPYRLKQRIGHLDLYRIVSELSIADIENFVKQKPSLHRYPGNIAKYIYSACLLLTEKYKADASNIWNKEFSTETIIERLEEFKGISHKKAALGCLLLVRDLGIDLKDKNNINIVYDIHIRRIFLRAGFCKNDNLEEVTLAAQRIYPPFPGRLTSSFWAIGRDFCRPSEPLCMKCPLDKVCQHKTYLGRDIHA